VRVLVGRSSGEGDDQNVPVLLKGPTGCGKTRFVEYMSWRLHGHLGSRDDEGVPLITVACHEDLTASDLVGDWVDGRCVVRDVRAGSDASRQGVKPGDVVESIDGRVPAAAVESLLGRPIGSLSREQAAFGLTVALAGVRDRPRRLLTSGRNGPREFALHSAIAAQPELGILPNAGYFITLNLTVPVWDWGGLRSKLHQTETRRRQAQVTLSQTQRQLLSKLYSMYNEALTARSAADNLQRMAELSGENLRLTALRYTAGEASAFEVVDAQNTAVQARNALDDAQTRYRVALAELQTLTGSF